MLHWSECLVAMSALGAKQPIATLIASFGFHPMRTFSVKYKQFRLTSQTLFVQKTSKHRPDGWAEAVPKRRVVSDPQRLAQ